MTQVSQLNIKEGLVDTLKMTGALMLSNMTINDAIRSKIPQDNYYMAYAADGVVFGLVSDAVDWVSGDPSEVVNMEWTRLADDMAYFGLISGVAAESGLLKNVYDVVNKVNPIGQDMSQNLTLGLVASATRLGMDIIDGSQTVLPEPVLWARRPVTTITNYLYQSSN